MKTCTRCNQTKPDAEYGTYTRKGVTRLNSSCKVCLRTLSKEWRKNNPEKIATWRSQNKSKYDTTYFTERKRIARAKTKEAIQANYLVGKTCVDCRKGDIQVLSFDHLRDKAFTIGNIDHLTPDRKQQLADEVAKCEVRCLNCHQIKTRQRRKDRLYCWVNHIPYEEMPAKTTKTQEERGKRRKTKYYVTNLPKLVNILKRGCTDCGYSNVLGLQFDHVRGDKVDHVSVLIKNTRAWSIVEAEITKCDIVCANCHRKRTDLRKRLS